jgi:hypothetical protein
MLDIPDQDIESIICNIVRLQRKTSVAEIYRTEWRCGRRCRIEFLGYEPQNFIVRQIPVFVLDRNNIGEPVKSLPAINKI